MKALLALSAVLLGACARGGGAPGVLAVLPDFKMSAVGAEGETPFGRRELEGRVWVADFIFTSCGTSCPLLSRRMAELAKSLPPEVSLLSVSVDPEGDSPERLRAYARSFGAEPERWVFLRGDVKETYRLLYAGFRLPMSVDPKAQPESRVQHSTRLVLLDKHAAVRGYYDGIADADASALARDARKLLEAGS